MVKYRERKDWASYDLARTVSWIKADVAQWQSWLRHARFDPPSLEELLEDNRRRENTRRLAKIADERWATLGSGNVERLAVADSNEALKGISSINMD